MLRLLKKIFDSNEREVNKLRKMVEKITVLEPTVLNLSDEQLKARTPVFRARLEKGRDPRRPLAPEAFATVREAAKRVRKERHYDVQMVGGIVLHQGRIAEMKTGEGKTPGGHRAAVFERSRRSGGPSDHGQRLPG